MLDVVSRLARGPGRQLGVSTVFLLLLLPTGIGDTFVEVNAEQTALNIPQIQGLLDVRAKGGLFGVTWSADDKHIAAFNRHGRTVSIWQAETGKSIQEIDLNVWYLGNALAFTSDDKQVLMPPTSGAPEDSAFSVVDVASGNTIINVPGPNPSRGEIENVATSLSMTHDRKFAAVVFGRIEGQPVTVFEAQEWQKTSVLSGTNSHPSTLVTSLAFSPDGKLIAVGQVDGQVVIYDWRTGEKRLVIPAFTSPSSQAVIQVTFSPKGEFLAVGASSGYVTWRNADNSQAAIGSGKFRFARNPDPIKVYDTKSGEIVHSLLGRIEPIRNLTWSANGRELAISGRDDQLLLWLPRLGHTVGKYDFGGRVTSVEFASTPEKIAVTTNSHLYVVDLKRQ